MGMENRCWVYKHVYKNRVQETEFSLFMIKNVSQTEDKYICIFMASNRKFA